MSDYRGLTTYWANQFNISEVTLAAVVAHEGGFIRRMGPFNRNTHLSQWTAWYYTPSLYTIAGPNQEPSIGIAQMRPSVAASMADKYWNAEEHPNNAANMLVYDDRYAIAMAAAYLAHLSAELELSSGDGGRDLFVAYALSPGSRSQLAENGYDYDDVDLRPTVRARASLWADALELLE